MVEKLDMEMFSGKSLFSVEQVLKKSVKLRS